MKFFVGLILSAFVLQVRNDFVGILMELIVMGKVFLNGSLARLAWFFKIRQFFRVQILHQLRHKNLVEIFLNTGYVNVRS